MEQIILVVHLLAALAIIGLIMLQQGKGADMGASFGAGASQTLFGSDGSGNVLTRATGWLVTLFFATSFGLALLANQASVEIDELGLDIPVEMQQQQVEEALPGIDDLPVLDEDIPAVMGSAEQDLPEIE
ncbi:MAG: preprotein translocase subunit SecG [Halioglobus sp.]|nr:preprotein translocase subunit SecG [Halioglobus sp.]